MPRERSADDRPYNRSCRGEYRGLGPCECGSCTELRAKEAAEAGELWTTGSMPEPPRDRISHPRVVTFEVPHEEREAEALGLVIAKRGEQNREHGQRDFTAGTWLNLLLEELGEAAQALNDGQSLVKVVEELQDVGALAIAGIASLWRQGARGYTESPAGECPFERKEGEKCPYENGNVREEPGESGRDAPSGEGDDAGATGEGSEAESREHGQQP